MVKELKDTGVIVSRSVRASSSPTASSVRSARWARSGFTKWRKALNILGDQPEDVAPWLVDKILRHDQDRRSTRSG